MNDVSWTSWLLFAAIAAILLAIDLFAHRGGKETSHRWAIIWSVIWIIAGLLFSVYVWYHFHALAAQEYLAAYLMEKSLSLDNLFVFLLIFQTLNIPHDHQHKALFWGILARSYFVPPSYSPGLSPCSTGSLSITSSPPSFCLPLIMPCVTIRLSRRKQGRGVVVAALAGEQPTEVQQFLGQTEWKLAGHPIACRDLHPGDDRHCICRRLDPGGVLHHPQ